jgi:hypothetical protein
MAIKNPASLWFRVIIGGVLLFLMSGMFFNYPALKPIFVNDGMYKQLCTTNNTLDEYELFNFEQTHKNKTMEPGCEKQNLRLNLLGQITSAGSNSGALVVGIIVDVLSPYARLLMMVCGVLWSLSFIMFGLGSLADFDLYIPSSLGIVLTGAILYMCVMRLRNYASTERQGTIVVSYMTAMWDLSTMVALLFNIVYFSTSITMTQIFCFYSILLVLILPYGALHLPFKFEIVENEEESIRLLESKKSGIKTYLISMYRSFGLELLFMYASMCMSMLSMYFYLSTVPDQLKVLTSDSNEVVKQIYTLSILLPVAGTIASIVIGFIKGAFSEKPQITFFILFVLNFLWTGLSLIPNSGTQYATMTVFVIWRISVFVVFFDHIISRYPKDCSFTLYSLGLTLAGLTTISSSGLNALVEYGLNGNFFLVNLCLGIANILLSFACVFVVMWKEKKRNQVVYRIN